MIETGQQARDAIQEIQDKTKWTRNIIANKARVHRDALKRLMDGDITNPHQSTMRSINTLLTKVRGME